MWSAGLLGFDKSSWTKLRKKVQILQSIVLVKYSVRLSGPATCTRAREDAWLSRRMPPSRRGRDAEPVARRAIASL